MKKSEIEVMENEFPAYLGKALKKMWLCEVLGAVCGESLYLAGR